MIKDYFKKYIECLFLTCKLYNVEDKCASYFTDQFYNGKSREEILGVEDE